MRWCRCAGACSAWAADPITALVPAVGAVQKAPSNDSASLALAEAETSRQMLAMHLVV